LGRDGVGTGWRRNGNSVRTTDEDGIELGQGQDRDGIRMGWGQSLCGSADGIGTGTGTGMRWNLDEMEQAGDKDGAAELGPGRGDSPEQGRAAGTQQCSARARAGMACAVPGDVLGPADEPVSVRPRVLTPAAVPRGVPVVAGLALGAVGPRRVVEAAQAAPRAPVARLWVRHVDVVVALAGQAAPAGLQRVPVVPRGTLVAAGTCRHRAPGSAWGQGDPLRGGHWPRCGQHPPAYPGLQWQTTCPERLSW